MTNYKAIKVNGKKIDEHRYVMEQYLGRPLSRYEVVHHKDGNKRNNDINNLEVMDLSQHSKHHRTGIEISPETKKKLSERLYGRKSPCRKLNDEQIGQINKFHEEGISHRNIAKIFGVSHTTIDHIINGETYKN
jgi:hypothetical protein